MNILVFRIGQLGDTMIALPALWAVRRHFQGARMTLLCDRQVGKEYVLAPDLLDGSGLFDDFMTYPCDSSVLGHLMRPLRMLVLLVRLRARGFDTLVYLAPTIRAQKQVSRDRRYFSMAGIRRFVGFEGPFTLPPKTPGRPLPAVPHEADLLLERLAASGIPVPPPGGGEMRLGVTAREEREVEAWLRGLPSDGGRAWIGVGPCSKMPAKVWPENRFRKVVENLIGEYDLWPVTFGGPEDRDTCERLILQLGRGHIAAGELSLRSAAAALRRCRLYLGNDAGPMHLAAAVGTPCVAVFSSRDYPGAWHPYGEGHLVLRTEIGCDGCFLLECVERRMECILSIDVEAVLAACKAILRRPPDGSARLAHHRSPRSPRVVDSDGSNL